MAVIISSAYLEIHEWRYLMKLEIREELVRLLGLLPHRTFHSGSKGSMFKPPYLKLPQFSFSDSGRKMNEALGYTRIRLKC